MNPDRRAASPIPPTELTEMPVATQVPTATIESDQPTVPAPAEIEQTPPPAPSPHAPKKFIFHETWKLLAGSATLALCCFALGMVSSDAGTVSATENFCWVLAIFMGVVSAMTFGSAMSEAVHNRERYGSEHNVFLIGGFISNVIPFVFFISPFLNIAGLIKRPTIPPPDMQSPRHINTFLKIVLISLSFLSGGITAFVIGAFAALTLWSRWCDLTSSKCL